MLTALGMVCLTNRAAPEVNLGVREVGCNLFRARGEAAQFGVLFGVRFGRRRQGGFFGGGFALVVQFVGQQQGGEHEEAGLAGLAADRLDGGDALFDFLRHFFQMRFLAVLAADGVGVAVDADGHLGHFFTP